MKLILRIATIVSLATSVIAWGESERAPAKPEAKPDSEPAEHSPDANTKSNWSVAGNWQVTHPAWKGTLIIRPDGTFLRPHGDGGKWTLTAEPDHLVLTLIWKSWVTDTAAMITPNLFTGKVRAGKFQLRRTEEEASVAAPAPKAAPEKALSDADLKEELSDSTWELPDGHFTLHADGSTTTDWHDRKGFWRIVGPNRVQLTISWREDTQPKTVTAYREATALRWSEDDGGKIARRAKIKPKKP